MGYTTAQSNALAIVPKFTAFLSFFGSATIITEVLYFDRQKLHKAYHRLILVMAIFDLFGSTGKFLSSWPIPRDIEGVSFAVGTTQSCAFQGFIIQVGVGEPMMTMCLSIYFFLVCHQSWSEDKIRKRAEPFFYAFAILLALITSITSLALDLFNFSGIWCWIAASPAGCRQAWENDGVSTCDRGKNSGIFEWAFYYAWIWFAIVFVMVLMILLYMKVRKLETANLEHRFVSMEMNHNDRNKHRSKSKKVATQGLLFVGSLYLTWMFPTINRIWGEAATGEVPFGIVLMHALLSPSQGFWNYLVYARPRYLRSREESGSSANCAWQCLKNFFRRDDDLMNTEEDDEEEARMEFRQFKMGEGIRNVDTGDQFQEEHRVEEKRESS
uniref:G-protein coupled receptors family 2 profile 2 domain-containing protein n=2 Tax=Attheya septentrionalis TaxID=420275 RepID=A0A7S2XK93_9STRA|mmetsp:Transcript_16510/g.30044  ORF Transcript_16510/g.30044 Transcript_16510/m.30044 type:complete len:384 (+) Transcript_16510:476-1627(+)